MKESEVREMASGFLYRNSLLKGRVEETHISWVIITRQYAFKIKKPITFSFLDFSTLALRRRFCEREVLLNSRFSTIYLSVEPIRFSNGVWTIGEQEDQEPIDYCVVMKRMATAKKMDNQLRAQKATIKTIKALALEVAAFHNKAEKIFIPFDLNEARKTFNALAATKDFVKAKAGKFYGEIIDRGINWSDKFLTDHANRLQQRIDHGLKRDVHGDLHSGNIFLYHQPVLFDCIEFNDAFRQIDVLYEIAFLCMDLEAFGRVDLAEAFMTEYARHFFAIQEREDEIIYNYFKCLRANVRATVHTMSAQQADNQMEFDHHLSEVVKYLQLVSKYIS